MLPALWNVVSAARVALTLAALPQFGGWDRRQRTSDTWELRDSQWVRIQDEGPSPRNHAVLVSASGRGSVILFGGHDGEMVLGDLWERRHGRWVL